MCARVYECVYVYTCVCIKVRTGCAKRRPLMKGEIVVSFLKHVQESAGQTFYFCQIMSLVSTNIPHCGNGECR